MIRVLMFGMFDRTYPRNRIVLSAMDSAAGVEVQICHEPMWELTRDKTRGYAGLWNRARLVMRMLAAYLRLPWRLWRMRAEYDVIWVGFPGHADMPVAWLIGRLTGRPVVFDAFISWYDSAVRDRRLFPKRSFTARLLRFFDVWSCRLADRVVLDTPQHAAFFEQMFKVPAGKLLSLPVGADERVFRPLDADADTDADADVDTDVGSARPFTVIQYAEFTPLHGAMHVLDAAARLRDAGEPVRFEMIGDGGPFDRALRQQAADRGLTNVTFHDYMSEAALVRRIAAADVCLGIFGATPKAARVVPNKVYQCLAMGKATITADTPAVRSLLDHGSDIYLCPAADGAALADAIRTLRDQSALRQSIADGGRRRFLASFTPQRLGQTIEMHLVRLLSQRGEASESTSGSPGSEPLAADG